MQAGRLEQAVANSSAVTLDVYAGWRLPRRSWVLAVYQLYCFYELKLPCEKSVKLTRLIKVLFGNNSNLLIVQRKVSSTAGSA